MPPHFSEKHVVNGDSEIALNVKRWTYNGSVERKREKEGEKKFFMFNLVFMQEWGYVEDKGEWNIKITPLEVQERRIEKK